MVKKLILAAALSLSASLAFSQDKTEDVSKMIREVIPVNVDKSLFKTTPPPTPTVATTDKKGKKKVAVTPPPTDTASVDTTGNTTMPAPASEVAKRAQIWMADKPTKYTKSNCSNGGNGIVCQVSFPYKVKELNPTDKVEGEITMTITVEAKEGKYRYTINNIKHKATIAESSGGDIYAVVPECGSMKLSDLSWKHIKSGAFADAKMVADDLKAIMAKFSGDAPKKDDW
ncbi:MAG TPA: hypothetical protein VF411_12950 [Bacteroidia bacterium]